jgi:hypothetical protein
MEWRPSASFKIFGRVVALFAANCLDNMETIMKTIKSLALAFSLILAGVTMAHAEDKCAGKLEQKVPHEIKGKKYVCDKCSVSSCDTGGSTISNCKITTNWTNCVEAPADKKK